MLGILLAQVWHWNSWTNKERSLVRVIVVCGLEASLTLLAKPQREIIHRWLIVQWIALIFSTASAIFVVNWFIYLYVDNYGKYAQFVNNACQSTPHSHIEQGQLL